MNKSFWIDVFLATVFIYIFMWGASIIYNNFKILNPVSDALGDTEITDLAFSKLRNEPAVDEKIVLVNFGQLDREGIAAQIRVLNKYNPKVIGIDALFSEPRDAHGDSVFAEALSEIKNLVLPHRLFFVDPTSDKFDKINEPLPEFAKNVKPSYVNLITSAGDQEQFKVVRSFTPEIETPGGLNHAFGVVLAEYYNPKLSKKFIDRNNYYETINFKRNIDNYYGFSNSSGKYIALDCDQVLYDDFNSELIEGKIIIMGYLGDYLVDTSWDDKFLTPLNETYTGRTNPDMFGAVVHANIVSMILEEDYIDQMNRSMGIFISVIICLLNVMLFLVIKNRIGSWYDGLTKSIQLFEIFLLFGVLVAVFHLYNYKLNLTVTMIAIVLSSDLLEFYLSVVKNGFARLSRK